MRRTRWRRSYRWRGRSASLVAGCRHPGTWSRGGGACSRCWSLQLGWTGRPACSACWSSSSPERRGCPSVEASPGTGACPAGRWSRPCPPRVGWWCSRGSRVLPRPRSCPPRACGEARTPGKTHTHTLGLGGTHLLKAPHKNARHRLN